MQFKIHIPFTPVPPPPKPTYCCRTSISILMCDPKFTKSLSSFLDSTCLQIKPILTEFLFPTTVFFFLKSGSSSTHCSAQFIQPKTLMDFV